MIGEIDIYGVFVPPLLLLAAATVPLAALVRAGLARVGAYRLVWHRPLFDLAVYVLLLRGVLALVQAATVR